MNDLVQTSLIAGSLLLALAATVLLVLDRRPPTWLLGGLAALEVGLVVQLVVGLTQLAQTDRDVAGLTFVGYLVGVLLVVPLAALWAVGEPSRAGTGVLVVALLVLPVILLRTSQVWNAGA